jgi:hypothetical protein
MAVTDFITDPVVRPTAGRKFARWHVAPIVLVIAWIVLQIAAGLTFDLKPESVQTPPPAWPKDVSLQAGQLGTIVLFLHPHCPCSRASVVQLDRLRTMASTDHVALHIVFVGNNARESTALTRAAESLSGVQLHFDSERTLARQFDASVSGETFAFGDGGKLIFHGGLTSARGHEGDSYALTALANWLRAGALPTASGASEFPTFGCRL